MDIFSICLVLRVIRMPLCHALFANWLGSYQFAQTVEITNR